MAEERAMAEVPVDTCVTLICELGCARVREVITVLRQGGSTPETAVASPAQRQQILRELEAIMAVYDARPH
jgi:hypothetical protein